MTPARNITDAERLRAAQRWLESARVRLSPGERVLLGRENTNGKTEEKRHEYARG